MSTAERLTTRTTRNLNPHAEARAAMWIWSARYANSGLGSMDFYDSLTPYEQRLCSQCVTEITSTRRKEGA